MEKIMTVYEDLIVWPGNQLDKPVGVNVSKHLRVVTIQETPFVYTEPYDPSIGCNATQRDNPNAIARMRCPKHLPNGMWPKYIKYMHSVLSKVELANILIFERMLKWLFLYC